jgi:hypothetical protein
MKLFFCLVFCGLNVFGLAQNQRISLQIGISQYPAASGWPSIHGLNDLDLLGGVFHQQGFAVRQLRESEASLEGIRRALDQLYADAQFGAVVHLHFSTHGQQMVDNNRDEFDGFDEALIPFNAPVRPIPGQRMELHLRDDELQQRIIALREKIGSKGVVWITLDACHSGTATRLTGNFRGTITPYDAKPSKHIAPDFQLLDAHSTVKEENLAALVIFSATTAQELNQEYYAPNGKLHGSLSFALAQCLSEPDFSPYVHSFFDRIRFRLAVIAPNQTPQLETTSNIQLWQKEHKNERTFLPIVKVWDAQTVMIGAGYLNGLYLGAEVILYAEDTKQVLGTGKISDVTMQEAQIELLQGIPAAQLLKSLVSLERTPKNFQALRVKLQADIPFCQQLRQLIQSETGIVEVNDYPQLIVAQVNQGYQLVLPDGNVIYKLDTKQDVARNAKDLFNVGILPRMKAHFLRQIEMDELGVVFRAVFYTNQNGAFQPCPITPIFKIGESFRLELTNTGGQNCYFHLLDIQSNDLISTIVPTHNPYSKPGDWIIKAGETKLLEPTWRITPPAGTETIKILVSNQPIDLSGLLGGDQGVSRGITSLFKHSISGQAMTALGGQAALSVQTIVITVKGN